MKNGYLLAILTGTLLVLLLTSQVLAQAPIRGWDKAEFGMSVEEIEAAYPGQTQELEWKRGSYHEFVLGRYLRERLCTVHFYLVDNRLFEIRLLFLTSPSSEAGVTDRDVDRFWLAALEIEDTLEKKYGIPLRVDRIGDKKIAVWEDEQGNSVSLVMDFGGGIFRGELGFLEEDDFLVYSNDSLYFTISYSHKHLTALWEKKDRTIMGVEPRTIEMESF